MVAVEDQKDEYVKKSIFFVTGTRAEFGKVEPLAVASRDAGFNVEFFVTGMHMLEKYGLTRNEVRKVDGISVFEFFNQRPGDSLDTILAKTIVGFSDFIVERKPDLVVVHGDRVEALACALACATNSVRCAHIEGGEVSGTIDEVFRHCNSKLATYHFVSSRVAQRRVMQLGESKETIYVIGSPELDVHGKPSGISIREVCERYEISMGEFGVVIFHSVTSEINTIGQQARDLFDALESSDRRFVVILPNNDPGHVAILDVLRTLQADQFRCIPSMRFHYFSELLKNSSAIIGNSSAGVREAPFLGIPSLDVGTRQTNRADTASITWCCASDKDTIRSFLSREWGLRYTPYNGFGGDGRTTERFLNALLNPEFWTKPLQKAFTDHEG